MNIRSMGPISEEDMAYSMDAYFRQTWTDKRLRFQGPMPEMAVHIKLLEKIWKPDTFFYNGRESYLHTITTPNKLLRIRQDGTILYSMRLTIKASCPMYLQYFPVDEQFCPLQFGSYAYAKHELHYIWKYGSKNSVKLSKDLKLSQFDLVGHPVWNLTHKKPAGVEFSTLKVNFRLQRHMGYFLIQVYVPCTLIVILSWVSFWINREATADRVGLGITTVLTLTTLSLDTRTDLPKVSYATALDWFIIMCFGYVIASLLEFAGVHYFTKMGSGEIQHDSDSEYEEEEYDPESIYDTRHNAFANSHPNKGLSRIDLSNAKIHTTDIIATYKKEDSCLHKFLRCLQGSYKYRKLLMGSANKSGVNSVSMIDKVSRILFPFSFIILNIIYWVAYSRYQSHV